MTEERERKRKKLVTATDSVKCWIKSWIEAKAIAELNNEIYTREKKTNETLNGIYLDCAITL